MSKIKIMILLVSILFSLSAHATSADKLSVAVFHIEDVLEAERNDLPYVKILNFLDQRLPFKLEYEFIHYSRVSETFNDNKFACLYPGYILVRTSEHQLIESTPIQVAKAYFIAKQHFNSQQLLEANHPPLRIGFRSGNTFGGQIDTLAHHMLIPLNSGSDIRNLLERDRIDAYIGYLPDSFSIINAIPDKPLIYSEASLFYSQNDSFLCQSTPSNQKLVASINSEIQVMKNSGELERILAPLKQTKSFRRRP